MKYCKFKSVDISKCINSGTTPKRGNPNEKNEEDELEKELKIINNEEIQMRQHQRRILYFIKLIIKISLIKLESNDLNTQEFTNYENKLNNEFQRKPN